MTERDMTEQERCPDCGAYDGHGPLCKLAPLEYKAQQLEHYYEMWLDARIRHNTLYERYKKDVTFWQGKFHMVKHENNALRAKLGGRREELRKLLNNLPRVSPSNSEFEMDEYIAAQNKLIEFQRTL